MQNYDRLAIQDPTMHIWNPFSIRRPRVPLCKPCVVFESRSSMTGTLAAFPTAIETEQNSVPISDLTFASPNHQSKRPFSKLHKILPLHYVLPLHPKKCCCQLSMRDSHIHNAFAEPVPTPANLWRFRCMLNRFLTASIIIRSRAYSISARADTSPSQLVSRICTEYNLERF